MVYSSSAIKAYLQDDDPFAIVGPQIQWAALGLVAMVVMMRVDYRWLRVASVPLFVIGIAGLLLVFVPSINVEVGGSARWLRIGPLPAVHPAEFMKLALVVYLAHWFAKRGDRGPRLLVGHAAVPRDHGRRSSCSCSSSRTSAPRPCSAFTAFTMFFLAGANLVHLVALARGRGPAVVDHVHARLPDGPDHRLARPVARPRRASASTASRASSRSRWAASSARASARAGSAGGLFLPNAFNDFIFAIIGEEFGLLGAGLVIVLFLAIGYLGIRTSPRRAGHVRGAAGGGHHRLDLPPGVHQHRRSWWGSSPSPASRCRSSPRAARP